MPDIKKAAWLFAFLIIGCTEKKALSEKTGYFNARNFINVLSKSLTKRNGVTYKTVEVSGKMEKRKLVKPDWKKELILLEDADIDKTAYYGAYNITQVNGKTTYTLKKGFGIPVKYLEVSNTPDGEPLSLKYTVANTSVAYNTIENGAYYKDCLLVVTKQERLKFLPARDYRVKWSLEK